MSDRVHIVPTREVEKVLTRSGYAAACTRCGDSGLIETIGMRTYCRDLPGGNRGKRHECIERVVRVECCGCVLGQLRSAGVEQYLAEIRRRKGLQHGS